MKRGEVFFRSRLLPISGTSQFSIAYLSVDTTGRVNTYVAGVTPVQLITPPAQNATLDLRNTLDASLSGNLGLDLVTKKLKILTVEAEKVLAGLLAGCSFHLEGGTQSTDLIVDIAYGVDPTWGHQKILAIKQVLGNTRLLATNWGIFLYDSNNHLAAQFNNSGVYLTDSGSTPYITNLSSSAMTCQHGTYGVTEQAIGQVFPGGVIILTYNAQGTQTGFGSLSATSLVLGGATSSQVVGVRQTGWFAPTGYAAQGNFYTETATLIDVARNLKGVIDALRTHGLIGN
jgi:hypothetical protein